MAMVSPRKTPNPKRVTPKATTVPVKIVVRIKLTTTAS